MTYPVWGWGGPADEPTRSALESVAPFVAETTGIPVQEPFVPRPLPELPPPRTDLPSALQGMASTDPVDRARHGIGRSYRDLIRASAASRRLSPTWSCDRAPSRTSSTSSTGPAAPTSPSCPSAAARASSAASSRSGSRGAVSLDLQRLRGLVEVDARSRAVRVRAGHPRPGARGGASSRTA